MSSNPPALQPDSRDERPLIAIFSGPTATVQNTPPLLTSAQSRRSHGLSASEDGYDSLRAQRLAAPVKVLIEAFTAHPLESDAAELYAEPDGYLDSHGDFHKTRQSVDDKPVYEAWLRPEDGLYFLPYMARQNDGSPWDEACTRPGVDASGARQTFYPDASRLVEEIDRFGLDRAGHNNLLARRARFDFIRVAPSGGYTKGLRAADRSDLGDGDIDPEIRGEDFFYYQPPHLAQDPTLLTLAHTTNHVQAALDSGAYAGAIWLEGSPAMEETVYWLNLLIDTPLPICGNSAQRPHGTLSHDGDRNIVDSVEYIASAVWADADGRDCLGVVVIQDELIFTSREVQKADARPGGYVATGGHGGVIGAATAGGEVNLTFRPNRLHTYRSAVNLHQIPPTVHGVARVEGEITRRLIPIKDSEGRLLPEAMPKVTLAKFVRYGMDDYSDDPALEVEIQARIEQNLKRFPLAGFVIEGNAPFGRTDESMTAALLRATFSGMPVVRVGRGNAEGVTPKVASSLFLSGSNLTATKARMLLMACLLRFGAAPVARDTQNPTDADRDLLAAYLRQLQDVFDRH